MPRARHILWDWNGTLLDDAAVCLDILNGMLARRGMAQVSAGDYATHFDFPVIDYYRHIGFDFATEPYADLAAEFVAEYDVRRFECPLQPHAREVLAAFTTRGVTQSILSAYEQSRLVEMVAATGLREHFTHLVGLDDYYGGGKVAQGRRMLATLEVDPASVVLIGDSLHDHEVATALGITCLLVPSGHYTPARLQTTGAPVLSSLAEVLSFIT